MIDSLEKKYHEGERDKKGGERGDKSEGQIKT